MESVVHGSSKNQVKGKNMGNEDFTEGFIKGVFLCLMIILLILFILSIKGLVHFRIC